MTRPTASGCSWISFIMKCSCRPRSNSSASHSTVFAVLVVGDASWVKVRYPSARTVASSPSSRYTTWRV